MTSSAAMILRVKLFEFYAKNIWPFHRRFVKGKIARRCIRCIASEKMVPLNADSICDLCQAAGPVAASSRQVDQGQLDEMHGLLQSSQGAGSGHYDALVLFSGGKDSTYMIRRLQETFPGLRILALTLNNGFMSPVALENIEELIVKLNVDHLFVRPKRDFYMKLFRYCITHLNDQGAYGTVDFSDGEFLLDTARTLAAEKRIPLILAGYSRYQVQNGLSLNHFESPRSCELKDRTETAGLALTSIFDESDVQLWWQASKHPVDSVARLLFPMYVWDLEEDQVKSKVTEWGLLSHRSSSPVVTNHQLVPLLGVVDVHQLGYSSFEIEFCRMIRENRARKEDWQNIFELLEYTSKTGMFVKPLVFQLLKTLHLTTSDVKVHFK